MPNRSEDDGMTFTAPSECPVIEESPCSGAVAADPFAPKVWVCRHFVMCCSSLRDTFAILVSVHCKTFKNGFFMDAMDIPPLLGRSILL